MASIVPIFDSLLSANGTVNNEVWVDVTASLSGGVIPSGQQIWLGVGIFTAPDKNLTFEIRPNLPTKSAGNTTHTQLRNVCSATTGESAEMDFHFDGAIMTLAPVTAVSTGVEKLWLRIRSGSNAVGAFEYMIFYSIY